MHVACSRAMASNVLRSGETVSEREERLRKRRKRDRIRRERETNEERQARFVSTCKYLVLPLRLWQIGKTEEGVLCPQHSYHTAVDFDEDNTCEVLNEHEDL